MHLRESVLLVFFKIIFLLYGKIALGIVSFLI